MQASILRSSTILCLSLGLQSFGKAQGNALFFAKPSFPFAQSYGEAGRAKLAVVQAVSQPAPIQLDGVNGSTYSAKRQRVRVLNPPFGQSEYLNLVSADARMVENLLPLERRVLLVYLEPRDGKVLLNINRVAYVGAEDVAPQVAVGTLHERTSPGSSFEERWFRSLVDAISGLGFSTMLDLAQMLPMPPGYDFSVATTEERRLSEFLKQVSSTLAARGGIFTVVFQAKLAYWSFSDSDTLLIDALLANLDDARVDAVLMAAPIAVSMSDLTGGPYASLNVEGQAALLSAAQNARSDRAAALFASVIHRPLKEETKAAYVTLLKREMPHLRAQVCNELARRTNKRERILPLFQDAEDWEARVAAMSRLWLQEYGLDG